MTIWVDADSCPRQVRDIVVRASERLQVMAKYVANRDIPILEGNYIEMVTVPGKQDEADNYIVDNCSAGDIVITRDIILADRLVFKGIVVINDRGDVFTKNNIKERLSIRNIMKDFRDAGIMDMGEKTYSNKEVHKFAACFDREITKLLA